MSQNRNQKNTHRKKTETSKSRVSDKNTSAKSKSASKAAKASGKSTASPRNSHEKSVSLQNTRPNKTRAAAPGVLSRGEKQSGRSKRKSSAGQKMNIIPLGGLGEIGKNITLYEYGEDMFIVLRNRIK